MGRRLPPGEAERRAKERARRTWSGETNVKYDPSVVGYGSYDQWIAAAEAITGTKLRVGADRKANPDLDILGLSELPETMEKLKRAYRNAMMVHHPDKGGDLETAKKVNLAFERLSKNYE